MKEVTNEAVSPVIGVLLMLVVTIIIAAIVSAFAGGLSSDESKAPQVSLDAKVIIEGIEDELHDDDDVDWGPNYPADFKAKNGILFEHKGGDPFSLNDIYVELENQGITMIVTPGDKLPSSTCLPSETTDGGYFAKVGASDKNIEPGDKFMLYADNCYKGEGENGNNYLLWTFDTGYGYGTVGEFYKYKIIDRKSSKPITAGEFLLK